MPGPANDKPRPGRRLVALTTLATFFLLATVAILSFKPDLTPTLDALRAGLNSDLRRQAEPQGDKYLLGVGKADITGPVVEVGFAGYASTDQVGSGVRQRLYSRTFIVGSVDEPEDRFVYIVIDTISGDTAVRNGALEGLKDLGDGYGVYTSRNVALTGTHSHAGPGASWNYLMPQLTTLGFDKQAYQAIVDGVVLSIKRAHESLAEVRPPYPHSRRSGG